MTAFAFSHTFNVTTQTYVAGLILLILGVFLFWLRFRKVIGPRPKWLLIMGNIVLVIFSAVFLLYLGGVATWYE